MQFTQNFLDPDAVAIIVQVAQVRVAAAAESSIQTAYLSVNDKVELDVKYADELGTSINQYEVLTYILTY
jgi:nuclear pore complex protein Nup210